MESWREKFPFKPQGEDDKNITERSELSEQLKRPIQNKNLFINELLLLQERWINKEYRISLYIEELHKTITQKDQHIQKIEKQNQKLRQKLQNQNQNNQSHQIQNKGNNTLEMIEKKDRMTKVQRKVKLNVEWLPKQQSNQVNSSERQLTQMQQNEDNLRQYKGKNLSMSKKVKYSQNQHTEIPQKLIKQDKKQLKTEQNSKNNQQFQPENQVHMQQKQIHSFRDSINIYLYDNSAQLQRKVQDNVRKILQQNNFIISKANNNQNKNDSFLNQKNIKIAQNNMTQTNPQFFIESEVNQECLITQKKQRQIRQTSTTDQTYDPNMLGIPSEKSLFVIKKNNKQIQNENEISQQSSCQNSQNQNSSNKIKPTEQYLKNQQPRHNFKSAHTIAYNNEQESQFTLMKKVQQNEFHSENKIFIPHNIYITPYQSGQATPQGSTKMIKIKSYEEANTQGLSQVQTVKRNPMSRKNDNCCSNQQKQNLRNDCTQNNLLRQESYGEQILFKNKNGLKKQKGNTALQSQNLIEQQTVSKNIIQSEQDQSQNQIGGDGKNQNRLERNFVERKKSRMFTNLSNLDYSLTDSNTSLTEIEGSLFRDKDKNHKKSMFLESQKVIVPIQEEKNQRESFKTQHQDFAIQTQFNNINQLNQKQSEKQRTLTQDMENKKSSEVQSLEKIKQNKIKESKIKKQNSADQICKRLIPNPNQQTNNGKKQPQKTTLKYNIKARLLVEQNSQTESIYDQGSSEKIEGNNFKKLQKKLSFSSSSGSKFYYPHEIKQENKSLHLINETTENKDIKNSKEKVKQGTNLMFNPNAYQCNIKNKSNIQQYHYEDHILQRQNQRQSTPIKSSKQQKSINNCQLSEQKQQWKITKNNRQIQEQKFHKSNIGKMQKWSKSDNKSYSNKNNDNKEPNYIFKKSQTNGEENFKILHNSNFKKYLFSQNKNPFSQNKKQKSTFIKQPQFDSSQYNCYTASENKKHYSYYENQSQLSQKFSKNRSQYFSKQRNPPQTKSTQFIIQKTHPNHHYVEKSSSSSSSQQQTTNHAFKKLYKFTTESQRESHNQKLLQHQNYQREFERSLKQQYEEYPQRVRFHERSNQRQRLSLHSNNSENKNLEIDVEKILFENSMLKSYNNTLQNKIKKSGKMEKLIEKFNSQNNSIRNRIHKKSIS